MKVHRPEASIGEKSNSHPEVHGDFLDQEQLDLDSMGYPKLPSSIDKERAEMTLLQAGPCTRQGMGVTD
uniref:Uncharacterized protein n=1 Tax=Oryza nivara TaxID=4536 RepID=A0A0E0JBY7_ORYNI